MRLGIDIGASKTQGVLYSKGELVESEKTKTDPDETLAGLLAFAKEFTADKELDSIGLSVAGTVDPQSGEISGAGNLHTLPGMPVKEKFEEEFKVPVFINNDGACFIWAEFLEGAASDHRSALGLTLGTGIGGGAVLNYDGHPFLYRGAFNSGFEVGHMVIRAGGADCGCGQKGCLEAYASSHFFKRQSKYSPITLQKKAEKGDERAQRIYAYYGHWLGIGVSNLINLFDPELIVMGGGLARAWDLFIDEVQEEIKDHVLSTQSAKKIQLKKARLGYRAPAIGAALLNQTKQD